jgi:hypothetical protein
MKAVQTLILATALFVQGCAARVSNGSAFSQFQVPTIGVDQFNELGPVELAHPIPVHTVCPSGFLTVDVYQNFFSDFGRMISFGMYTPAKTHVSCKSGAEYMVGLNHQGLVAVLKQVKQSAEHTIAAIQ